MRVLSIDGTYLPLGWWHHESIMIEPSTDQVVLKDLRTF